MATSSRKCFLVFATEMLACAKFLCALICNNPQRYRIFFFFHFKSQSQKKKSKNAFKFETSSYDCESIEVATYRLMVTVRLVYSQFQNFKN